MDSNEHQFDDEHWNYQNLNFHIFTSTQSYKFNGYTLSDQYNGYTNCPIDRFWDPADASRGWSTYTWASGTGQMPEKQRPPIKGNTKLTYGGGETNLHAALEYGSELKQSGEVIDSMRIVDQPFLANATKFKHLPHHVLTGWTHTRHEEDEIHRCHILWSPHYEWSDPLSSSARRHSKPFHGFYRTETAIPISLPGYDSNGFMDTNSDFGYMVLKRIYGMSVKTVAGGHKSTKLHPLRDRDFVNPDVLLGYSPGHSYACNLPSDDTYYSFLDGYWRPTYDSGYMVPSTDPVYKAYAGWARSTFAIKLGFTYNGIEQSFNTFPIDGASRCLHPYNEYLKGKYEADGYSAEFDTLLEKFLASTDLFVPRVSKFKYHFACAQGGRLGPSDGFIEADAIDVWANNDKSPHSAYDPDQGVVSYAMPYLRCKTVDRASVDTITHKLRFPRPYDGQELRQHLGFDAWYTGDASTWPDVRTVSHLAEVFPDSSVAKMQMSVEQDAVHGLYRMYWGPITHSGRGDAAYNRDYREKLLYYGDPLMIDLFAWMRFQMYVANLSKMWTYDDTPKEARIRMQKMPEYRTDIFSSISDGSDEYRADLGEYTEYLKDIMVDDRLREFGFRPTEDDIAEVEAATGHDYSHRL
jgi:hypothetical protein